MNGLLLTRVRDLRDRMHTALVPVSWSTNATVVVVAQSEERTVASQRAVPGLNLQVLVHDDPITTAEALLAEGLLGHEIV